MEHEGRVGKNYALAMLWLLRATAAGLQIVRYRGVPG